MDNKLLLVKACTLLYRESLLTNRSTGSNDLVRTVLESVKGSEVVIGVNNEREILVALKKTILEMCENPPDHIYEHTELLQRLKLNCHEDDTLYESFVTGIAPEMAESSLKRTILNIQTQLKNHFKEVKLEEELADLFFKFKHRRSSIKSVPQFVQEGMAKLAPYSVSTAAKDPAVIGDVEIHDTESVKQVYASIKEQESGLSILKCGYQGINRMLDGGFRRGEQWVFGAMQHGYKTGFSLTIFKQFALYNTPIMKDPTKKPLLLRISFEDGLPLNFQFLYKNLKENETGKICDTTGITDEEMSDYVTKSLSVNGWHVRFMHVNPSAWSYIDVCNKIMALEAEGYEIHVCMLDYLLKLPTTGCDQGPAGVDIRNLYERTRNFLCTSKDILLITPHQLSTDAKNNLREGRLNFVKTLPGMGYYAGCKQIDQVVDGELFLHKEVLNGDAYLTIQRGKHRIVNQVDQEEQYMVLKFVKKGIIPDDFDKPDSTRRKVGGDTLGNGGANPYWELSPDNASPAF